MKKRNALLVLFLSLLLSAMGQSPNAQLNIKSAPYGGDDSDHGVSRPAGLIDAYTGQIDAYTGNLAFGINDLKVSGAVGQYGLSWRREATSRISGLTPFFGSGHNWAHNWQWEMRAIGTDSDGHNVIVICEPAGWRYSFTETTPGHWTPAPSVRNTMLSDGNDFRVLRDGAGEVRFTRHADKNGVTFELTSMIDSVGNAWNFGWEGGRLTSVTEPAGRWLKISYSELAEPGAIQSRYTVVSGVTASDGQKVGYQYAFLGGGHYPVLNRVIYSDGTIASYTYEEQRAGERPLLTKLRDPHSDRSVWGRTFRYRRETDAAWGQLEEINAESNGAVFQAFAKDVKNQRAYAVLQENGATHYETFLPGGNLAERVDALGSAKRFEYDAGGRGFKIAMTDELGRITRYQNSATGQLLRQIAPDGSARSFERDSRGRVLATTDELGRTRRYIRDDSGRVIRMIYPDGSEEVMTYNKFGQVMTRKDRGGAVAAMTYDARGLLTKTTNAFGATTTFAYDEKDRLIATTDARGNTTRHERDTAGRVIKTTYADGSTTSAIYDEMGQLIQSVDATGGVRRMTYDNFGRLVATVDALGHETRTEYAPIGEIAPVNRPVKSISASGRATVLTYDAAGRLVARTAAAGSKESATTRIAYDSAGRQSSLTNPLGKTVRFFYDERNRRIKMMSALNYAATAVYDAAGNMISETDPKGNTTRWTYDAMGRELTKTDAMNQTTRREYNAAGRLVALIDAKLNTHRFEYDLLGRQTAVVYPDGSRETTSYDAAGLKVRYTNRAGTVRVFNYDNRNREISSEWSDGSQKIIKAYDAAGRLTLADNGVSKLTFTHDAVGRLASETQDLSSIATNGVLDPAARSVSYTYNADGQSATIEYPDGSFVGFSYNAQGALAQILGDGGAPVASYEYDAAGNATLMPRANDTETERQFDAENKTLTIIDRVAGQGDSLSELDYVYDETGNRTATMATVNSVGVGPKQETLDTYGYDGSHQVTKVDYSAPVRGNNVGAPASVEKFTYDSVGNRIEVAVDGKVTRYSANALNQYTQVGQFIPTYDRNGNLSGMGQWIYSYDALNRLVLASNGQMTAHYFYDAKNRCVARSYQQVGLTGSKSTLTLNTYSNWNLIEERDGSGAQIARYVHSQKIDEIIVMTNRHGIFYPHRDVLGNVTMLTNKDGRLVERYTYSVTGQVALSDASGQMLAQSAVDNRWMFTGREWLQEVGLYDYRNRVYSAELGRFVQTDPIRFMANDINIYRYVGNGFVSRTDPSGLVVLMFGVEFDVVPGVGIEGGAGLYIDTDNPYNSGPYLNAGPAAGWNFGLSGQFVGGGDMSGWGNGVDVSGAAAGAVGVFTNDAIVGGGITVGAGAGYSASRTYTAVLSPNTMIFAPTQGANNVAAAAEIMRGADPSWGGEQESLFDRVVTGFNHIFGIFTSIFAGFFE